MLGTGLCDSAIVLEEVVEAEVVVESVADSVDEADGCRLTDWSGVDDTEAV